VANNQSRVDLGGLQTTAASQGAAVQDGRTEFRQMMSQAEALATTWQGPAATSFSQGLSDLNVNGTRLFDALQRMQELMQRTHTDFSNTNDTTHQGAQNFAGNVGASAPTGLAGL
jgi:WXG100 family type VII secretion target